MVSEIPYMVKSGEFTTKYGMLKVNILSSEHRALVLHIQLTYMRLFTGNAEVSQQLLKLRY